MNHLSHLVSLNITEKKKKKNNKKNRSPLSNNKILKTENFVFPFSIISDELGEMDIPRK